MTNNNHPDIGDEIEGITTSASMPANKQVKGKIIGIDPKPGRHNRAEFMYYCVLIPGQTWPVYILSKIPRYE